MAWIKATRYQDYYVDGFLNTNQRNHRGRERLTGIATGACRRLLRSNYFFLGVPSGSLGFLDP
jgi:hypothetical protein